MVKYFFNQLSALYSLTVVAHKIFSFTLFVETNRSIDIISDMYIRAMSHDALSVSVVHEDHITTETYNSIGPGRAGSHAGTRRGRRGETTHDDGPPRYKEVTPRRIISSCY